MTFTVANYGRLLDPNLHDGHVEGLQLLNDKTLRVSLRDDVCGDVFVMELSGLVECVCNDFQTQNIIFSITIISQADPDIRTLEQLFTPPAPSARKQLRDEYVERLKGFANRIKEGALCLVSIDPSVGCYLVALCERVMITPATCNTPKGP
jgi:hypothetical protein